MVYPVTLEADDNGTILVSFPDFPEAHTFGDGTEDALHRAQDCLATIIDAYIKDRRAIPSPSAGRRARTVRVPSLIEAKVQLYNVMRAGGVGKAQLAKRLGWHLPQVDRLLQMTHGSRLEQLEAAFGALGKRIVLHVEDAVPAASAPRKRPRFSRRSIHQRRRSEMAVTGARRSR
jgi:antitoxin HicB